MGVCERKRERGRDGFALTFSNALKMLETIHQFEAKTKIVSEAGLPKPISKRQQKIISMFAFTDESHFSQQIKLSFLKSVDGVPGFRTRGRRLVSADEWFDPFYFFIKSNSRAGAMV